MSSKSATAYDYRRYIELVQVLAMDDPDKGIRALCEAWDVTPIESKAASFDGIPMLYQAVTIQALAKAALEYHRGENVD